MLMGITKLSKIFNINDSKTPLLHLELCRKNGIEIQRFDDNEFASMIVDNVGIDFEDGLGDSFV